MARIEKADIKRWGGAVKCDQCGRWVGVGGWFTRDIESGHVDEVLCTRCAPEWTGASLEEVKDDEDA